MNVANLLVIHGNADEFRIVKETPDKITLRRTLEDGYVQTSYEQKLLCIGGSLNGQRRAAFQIEQSLGENSGYIQYNRGEWREKGTPNKAVYIHESYLK
jgi:hypothetical protein